MNGKIKLAIIYTILFILSSCGTNTTIEDNNAVVEKKCNNEYKIGEINKDDIRLKGVVLSDEITVVSSPMNGTISYLNCNAGKKVSSKTLIAKIDPDFNNPNTINLSIQKGSLSNQKNNLESVKISTISGFDIQISNLDNQIKSIEEQKKLLKKNTVLTERSSNLSKDDLKKQIESLEYSLNSLKDNLTLVKRAKTEALDKINISKKTLFNSLKNISKDNLLKIDEVFGITITNRTLNDTYDIYISAKNINLRREVESSFHKLNLLDINTLDDKGISLFLGDLISLDSNARDAMKESISNIHFTQSQIDGLYAVFLNYSNSLISIKDSWDALDNSRSSIITNYDTQISSLNTQITTSQTNLTNLKTNKTNSIDVGLDLQLSGLDSQLKTLDTNLDNLKSQRSSLLNTKKTQILNIDNQILQISQSIDSLNVNLSSRKVYSGISGIIKSKSISSGNKVGINTPICNIIPNTNSKRIKIFSPVELNLGDKLSFNLNGKDYNIEIVNVLIYKDPITQNYVYESNYLDEDNLKDGEILSLNIKESVYDTNIIKNKEKSSLVKVPVSYIKNKIDGNFISVKSGSTIIEKKVKIGDINGKLIEVDSGLEGVNKICK